MTMSTVAETAQKPNCIFCKIIRKDVSSNILHEDDKFLVFPDHRPAATHHYLVIPRQHIREVRDLNKSDVSMVREMEEVGLAVLDKQGGERDSAVTGFHWPIHTVGHLHMHVMAGVSGGVWNKIAFSSYFFGTTEQAIQMMEKKTE